VFRAAILVSLASLAFGQVQPTSIVGPIYDTFGNPYTGSFTVQSQTKTNTGYAITAQPIRTVYVTAGVIGGLSLVPNDTSTPNLTSYLITFANKETWVCIIPTSSSPVGFGQYCAPGVTQPTTALPIALSQIMPCPGTGISVIATVGGIVRCAPQQAAGIVWYQQAVTASTSVAVTALTLAGYGIVGNNLIVMCDGIAECGAVKVDASGNVTVTSLTPWSGTLWIGTGRSYSASFTSATSVTVTLPVHGLNGETLAACYDVSGNQFGAGAVTPSLHDTGIGGAQGFDYTIALGSPAQSGRCVMVGF